MFRELLNINSNFSKKFIMKKIYPNNLNKGDEKIMLEIKKY